MQNSKLITLLKSMQSKELRAFESYLQGFHPDQKVAIRIFNYFKDWHPNYETEKLEKFLVYREVFGDEPYQERRLADGIFRLYQFLKQFLVWREMIENKAEAEYTYLKVLKKRKLDDLFQKQVKLFSRRLEEAKHQDELTYLWKFLINRELFFYAPTPKFNAEVDSLHLAMSSLDQFFISAKLKLATEVQSRAYLLNEKQPILFLEEVLEVIAQQAFQDNEMIMIYSRVYEMLKEKHLGEGKGDEIYQQLRDELEKGGTSLTKANFQVILMHLINFAASRIRAGQAEYYDQVFQLYQIGFDREIFFEEGFLSPTMFLNRVYVACELQRYDWASSFLDKYSPKLKKESREACKKIAQARICFGRREFDNTLVLLRELSINEPLISLRVRSLLMRSFVELDEDGSTKELIHNNCLAFKRFLKRNTVMSKSIKRGYFNLIKMVTLLYKKNPDKDQLLERLATMEEVACKAWIIDIIKRRTGHPRTHR